MKLLLAVYAVALASLPFFISVLAIVGFGTSRADIQAIFAIYLNYGLLLISGCLAAVALSTVALYAVLDLLGVINGWRLQYARAFHLLSVWAGGGTVVGALAACLTPVLGSFLSTSVGEMSGLGALPPTLMFKLATGGGLVGFTAGLLQVPFAIAEPVTNLIYRWVVIPTPYVVIAALASASGLNPAHLLSLIAHSLANVVTIPASATLSPEQIANLISSDWRIGVVLLGRDSTGALPGASGFTWIIVIAFGLIAAFGVMRAFAHRSSERLPPRG
ncbi:hypothetical protein [Microbacterium sp. MPKO10]|uniref:hypothetical protein n=1 Tax=Microbacterium sp. MPKO10 TaxID=2989818 RepID=UPI00223592F7|nr:hypothetical protein [Microbacterium sp. MPKO10]MCW4459963.1 hypothetical protein [Microbacterium sp. MPKO10]